MTAQKRNGWNCLREGENSMRTIRVLIAKILFRLAYWVQPKDIREIKKIEGNTITVSSGGAFRKGDTLVIGT